MKVLFLARHFSYLRNFESAIREMARRGHTVHLSADREESMGGRGMVERIAADYPNVTVGWTPGREPGAWTELARKIRLGLDYLRFLQPRYAKTPHLRNRARERAPLTVVALTSVPVIGPTLGRWVIGGFLRLLERGIPRAPEIDAYIKAQAPDLVLITPLVDLGSPQADLFASTRAAGIRTVLCVGSWDHLSSKALLRQMPERVVVWNDVQKQEAIKLHRVPANRVSVTGAQSYDHWFNRAPARSRAEFCHRVGLDADKPYILWVCSSLFRNTANEAEIVEAWIQALRGSDDPWLREVGILVRPHPARMDEWQHSDLTEYRNVAFWGAHPVDDEAKDDYFDSLVYSAAVVGLNTSAFLEAGIVGRPVHSILLPHVTQANQEGLIHFNYLLNVNGGLLHTSRSFEENLQQLRAVIETPVAHDEKGRRFTEAFIRPFGLDAPAAPKFADVIEAEAARGPAPIDSAGAIVTVIARAILQPALLLMRIKVSTQMWRKEMRYKTRKAVRRQSKQFWMRLKTFASVQIKGKRAFDGRKTVIDGANLTPKLGKPRDPAKSLTFPGITEVDETKETITILGRTNRPILVGPWVTETGFELLYWIPFLHWAKAYGGLREDRLHVVSRGGCSSWYRHITPNYFDVLSFYSADEFRQLNEERVQQARGRWKHMDVSSFDEAIIERATRELGLDHPVVLHPSLMYNLFNVFWKQLAPLTLIEAFTAFKTLPAPPLGELKAHLPDQYIAVKFYSNMALPDSAENRAMIAEVLRELSRTTDVVLLSTGQRFDDHTEYPIEARGRIHTIDHLMTPQNNLDVQTRVIAGASAFVGTYGGFSYLAPLLGTDTLAFFSHPTGFRWDHLELAKRVFNSVGGGSFVALDARDIDVVKMAFAGTAAKPQLVTKA